MMIIYLLILLLVPTQMYTQKCEHIFVRRRAVQEVQEGEGLSERMR